MEKRGSEMESKERRDEWAVVLELVPGAIFIGFVKADAVIDVYLFYSVDCFLTFLIVSFEAQKFLF